MQNYSNVTNAKNQIALRLMVAIRKITQNVRLKNATEIMNYKDISHSSIAQGMISLWRQCLMELL